MGFPINPPRSALGFFVDGRGQKVDITVEREWYSFFAQIQKAIGGASDPFEDTIFLTGPDARAVFRDEDSPLLAPPQNLAHSAVTDGDKGDITVTNSGATWTIDNNVVTFAKMQDITTDRLIGRDTAATGDPEHISVTGGIEFTGSASIQTSAFTGDVTKAAGGTALTIANDAVTYAKMQNISATDRLLGRDTAGAGDTEELTVGGGVEFTGSGGIQRSALTGDVTASAGSGATTIPNDTVTYAKMQNVSAASKLLGRGDSGAGDVQEITLGTNITMSGTTLNVSAGTATLGDGDYGDITVSGSGTVMTIDAGVVTYAKFQDASAGNVVLTRANSASGDYGETSLAASRLLGRGSTGDIAAISLGGGMSMSGTTMNAAPQYCLVSRSTAQTAITSTVAITWDTDVSDPQAMHDTGSNTDRVTFASAGTAIAMFSARSGGSISGQWGAIVQHNNSSDVEQEAVTSETDTAGGDFLSTVAFFRVAANDFLRCQCFATASRDLDTSSRFKVLFWPD